MKPEKMTDEALGAVLADVKSHIGAAHSDILASHIAALEAERDEAVRVEKHTRNAIRGLHLDMDNAGAPGTNSPIEERVRLLCEERDALRERGQALESEVKASEGLERERATMEEEAQAFRSRAEAAESRLAAIRRRVGDDARLAEVLEENVAKGGNAGLRAVASFIVGDAPVDGTWEGPAHPSPEHDHRYRWSAAWGRWRGRCGMP